jgi:short-subunit dehydrogenase involved in D-alanine esterification of teichoic acids
MASEKDRNKVKRLIEEGHISTFREVLDFYPITDLIGFLKTNHSRLSKYFNNPGLFRFEEIIKIANYLQVNEEKMISLVYKQIQEDRKSKKKR